MDGQECLVGATTYGRMFGWGFDQTWRGDHYECDQIGLFVKVFGDNFSYKSSPNVCWLFGLF